MCHHGEVSTSPRQLTLPRLAVLVVVVGVIILTLVLGQSSSSPRAACRPSTLSAPTTMSTGPSTTLPPSNDNDAGRSRVPDVTPDADNDARRAFAAC
jgi:hypothetical protein